MRKTERWCAALVTLAVHVGLIWIFIERPPARPASADAVIVAATLIESSAPSLAANAMEQVAPPTKAEANLVASMPQPATSDAARGILEHGPTSKERFGYLPYDEVDQAAVPIGDWVIDTDRLPRGATVSVVLQIWISASGVIDRWELVGDTDNEILARRALSDLARTPMQPAFRNQIAVANYRRLQIVLQRD